MESSRGEECQCIEVVEVDEDQGRDAGGGKTKHRRNTCDKARATRQKSEAKVSEIVSGFYSCRGWREVLA